MLQLGSANFRCKSIFVTLPPTPVISELPKFVGSCSLFCVLDAMIDRCDHHSTKPLDFNSSPRCSMEATAVNGNTAL